MLLFYDSFWTKKKKIINCLGSNVLKNNKRLCIKKHFRNYYLEHFYTLLPSLQWVQLKRNRTIALAAQTEEVQCVCLQ